MKTMAKKTKTFLIFTALAVFALGACSPQGGKPAGAPQAARPAQNGMTGQSAPGAKGFGAVPVLAVTAKVGLLTAGNDTAATVTPFMQSTVAAQVAGVVLHVVHLAGVWVKEGEPVVVLDTAQLKLTRDNAQAALDNAKINYEVGEDNASRDNPRLTLQVQSAQSALDSAQKNYDSQKALLAIGGTPASSVDSAKSQLQQAQANLQAAQTALEQNRKSDIWALEQLRLAINQAQLQLQTAQLNLDYASINAPFSGQISAVNVNPGMYVKDDTPVFIIVSVDKEINFNVPPSDAPNLPIGTTVEFVYQGHPWPVKVSQAPSAPINGVIPMVAAVPRTFPLPYGAVGTVSYSLTLAHGAIVPIGALQTNEDKEYVFAILNGKAVIKNVTILGQSESSAAVSGVEDGTQVILNPPPGLLEGVAVQIVASSQTAQGASGANQQSSPSAAVTATAQSQGAHPAAVAADPTPAGVKGSGSLPSTHP
jgi:RND family efflux transporter MFP subunit